VLNNKTILLQIFHGEIHPSESIGRNGSPELKKIQKAVNDANDDFGKLLSDNDMYTFQNLLELQNQSTGIYGAECFTYGFRLGIRLLLEILPDGDILSQITSEQSNKNSDNVHRV